MNSGMNSPGAAATSSNMKIYREGEGDEKDSMRDHGGAMIVINFFIPPLSFMLQLAAAAPGLFMPLFMLLLKMILLKILVIIVGIIINVTT